MAKRTRSSRLIGRYWEDHCFWKSHRDVLESLDQTSMAEAR